MRFWFLIFLFCSFKQCSINAQSPDQLLNATINGDQAWFLEGLDKVEPSEENNDPLEPLNRIIFGFNEVVDGLFLKPLSVLYDDALPEWMKTGFENIFRNLWSPITTINCVLQGRADDAAKTVMRFVVNTTIGLFGLIDAAKNMGIEPQEATMNETLLKWEVLPGPYLVLPIWGPSSFRGTVGLTVDWLMDPWFYFARNRHRIGNSHRQQLYLLYVLYGLDSVRLRAKYRSVIDEASRSPDPYVMIRSLYYQHQKTMGQKSQGEKKNSF